MAIAGKWLFPKVDDFLFIVVAATATLLMGERLLLDADAGWHVKVGDFILEHRTLVHRDLFSYGKYGQEWVAWEWLYDVVLSLANRCAGLRGVVLLSSVVLAATFRKLLATLLDRKINFYASLSLVLVAFGAVAIHAFARPHLVSWYFTLTLYVWLDDFESGRLTSRALWWRAPLLMALWVNLHGGFVIGLLLAAAFVRTRATLALWAAMLLATFCSPYGYRLHLAIYRFIGNPVLMETIEEFRSPNFHIATAKFLIAFLLVAVLAPAYSKSRPKRHEVLVLVLSLYAALFSARGIPGSVLVMTVILAPHVTPWFSALEGRSSHHLELRATLKSPLPALVAVAALGALARWGQTVARFPEERFPIAGARDYLAAHREIDHVLSPDFYAGYLLYYLPVRLAMDSRFDFLGEEHTKEYETVARVYPGWDDVLDRWKVRYVLFPSRSTLVSALREDARWRVLFEDGGAVVFGRRQDQ